MTIKTLHGKFVFNLMRFVVEGANSHYFEQSGQFLNRCYETSSLRDYSSKYATLLSYSQVEDLLKERCGGQILSDQRIHGIVSEEAHKIGQIQLAQIDQWANVPMPLLKTGEQIDLYDATAQEVLLMEDGISVAKQKPKRDNQNKNGKERLIQDIVLFQKSDKTVKRLVAAQGVSLTELTRCELKKEYGCTTPKSAPLSIVVLSDGATTIKNRYQKLLGQSYRHILDWYHLQKKVFDLMSMIAHNKQEKELLALKINALLWVGKSQEVLDLLTTVKARNVSKLEELVKYLTKNQYAIIDYQRRQNNGKTIGSGAMEKTVHILVGKRQKAHAKSWSPAGSNNLAVLDAYIRNKAA